MFELINNLDKLAEDFERKHKKEKTQEEKKELFEKNAIEKIKEISFNKESIKIKRKKIRNIFYNNFLNIYCQPAEIKEKRINTEKEKYKTELEKIYKKNAFTFQSESVSVALNEIEKIINYNKKNYLIDLLSSSIPQFYVEKTENNKIIKIHKLYNYEKNTDGCFFPLFDSSGYIIDLQVHLYNNENLKYYSWGENEKTKCPNHFYSIFQKTKEEKNKKIIVTEGRHKAIALQAAIELKGQQSPFYNYDIIALNSITTYNDFAQNEKEYIQNIKEIIIAYDNDVLFFKNAKDGQENKTNIKQLEKTINKINNIANLQKNNIKIMLWSDDEKTKGVDDFLLKNDFQNIEIKNIENEEIKEKIKIKKNKILDIEEEIKGIFLCLRKDNRPPDLFVEINGDKRRFPECKGAGGAGGIPSLYDKIKIEGKTRNIRKTDVARIVSVLEEDENPNKFDEACFIPIRQQEQFELALQKLEKNNKKIYNTFNNYEIKETKNINQNHINIFIKCIKNLLKEEKKDYFLSLLLAMFSHWVRRPFEKKHLCPIIGGAKGIGKTTIADTIGGLFDPYYIKPNAGNFLDFSKSFNGEIRNASLICFDEFPKIKKNQLDRLNSLISDSHIIIENKGETPQKMLNLANVMILTNDINRIQLTKENRRFIVFECRGVASGTQKIDFENDLKKLRKAKEEKDFLPSLLSFFIKEKSLDQVCENYTSNIKISYTDNIHTAPTSRINNRLQTGGESNQGEWVYELLHNKKLPPVFSIEGLNFLFSTEEGKKRKSENEIIGETLDLLSSFGYNEIVIKDGEEEYPSSTFFAKQEIYEKIKKEKIKIEQENIDEEFEEIQQTEEEKERVANALLYHKIYDIIEEKTGIKNKEHVVEFLKNKKEGGKFFNCNEAAKKLQKAIENNNILFFHFNQLVNFFEQIYSKKDALFLSQFFIREKSTRIKTKNTSNKIRICGKRCRIYFLKNQEQEDDDFLKYFNEKNIDDDFIKNQKNSIANIKNMEEKNDDDFLKINFSSDF